MQCKNNYCLNYANKWVCNLISFLTQGQSMVFDKNKVAGKIHFFPYNDVIVASLTLCLLKAIVNE